MWGDSVLEDTDKEFQRRLQMVNAGIRTKENVIIHENDEIAIYIADEFLFKKVDYQVIYEDDNILVINKPSGIEVVCSHSEEKSLSNILKEKYSFVEPCHRLDRNTSRFSFICKK